MYRTLLAVPITSPLPSLCLDMGGTQMRFRIIKRKLEFLWHLVNLEEETLAKEILKIQMDSNLPGLATECRNWLKEYKLPDIFIEKISQPIWKRKVKEAIQKENEDDLRRKMLKYDKLKNSELINETFETKPYLRKLSVQKARIIFKKRVSMMQHVKMNYMSDLNYVKTMWLCDSCGTCMDSMNHVLWCQSYAELRIGRDLKNDHDLASYLHDVFKIRSKLDI